jgi:hypothetical protein
VHSKFLEAADTSKSVEPLFSIFFVVQASPSSPLVGRRLRPEGGTEEEVAVMAAAEAAAAAAAAEAEAEAEEEGQQQQPQ